MERLSIRARIYAGFGAILGMLGVISAVGFTSAFYLGSIFSEYRSAAIETKMVSDVMEDLFEARMAALKYRLDTSVENAADVDSNVAEVERDTVLIAELAGVTGPKLELVSTIAQDASLYRQAFQDMRALQAQREELVAVLVATGPKARKQLTTVMETAYRDKDSSAAYYTGLAQQDLLLGRFYTERFLLTNSSEALEKATYYLETAAKDTKSLLDELQDPERRRLATETAGDLELYLTTVRKLSDVIFERNEIRSAKLDTIGPKMQLAAEEFIDAAAARQDALGAEGANAALWTRVVVALIAAVALGLGLVAAVLIARALVASVGSSVHQMQRLAAGDLEVDVTGAEHKHELGDMARALQVFKKNAVAMREMEADKEAAAARAAEEARAAITAALSEVASAAADGDFSQRMRTDFEDRGQVEIALSVNKMLEAVDDGLSETERVIGKLAQGDLTDRMSGDMRGAFANLQVGVNETFERLSQLVGEIIEASAGIHRGMGEISDGAAQLSERAEQQASALEQTAASMEEMAATVKQNAENATTARDLAGDASSRASDGGGVTSDAVNAMSTIEASAAKIGDIVSVIDGIAFQTNLLALNAAVEAARAGDAGKGFAVVASEVRELAQRSSEAARDIRSLIDQSTGQVSEGARLVGDAGDALAGIVESVTQVEASIRSIAEAGVEQSSGVSEVTRAVSHMDAMTQQNAAMASESVANARGIASRVDRLQELVAFFKVSEAATSREAA